MALLCFFIYRNKLKGVCKMKNLRNKADVEISIQINKKEIGASTVHVNEAILTAEQLADCLNNPKKCNKKMTKELAVKIKEALAFNYVNELLWQRGSIEKVLADAFQKAETEEEKESILSLAYQIVPLIPLIYDPVTNVLNKADMQIFKGFKTHDQAITKILVSELLRLNVLTCSAAIDIE